MAVLKPIVRKTRSPRAAKNAGAAMFALAALWLAASIAAVVACAGMDNPRAPFFVVVLVGVVAAAIGVTVLSLLGDLYGQHARDLKAQAIYDAVARGEDPPPYVLYLRPFASTGAFSETSIGAGGFSPAAIAMGGIGGTEFELEAQIERAVRPLGALVALGEPLEHIGAGRIRATDETWRDAVRTLLKKAALIVLLPSSRAGTLEEIKMILQSDMIQRTVVLDPPNISRAKNYDQKREWEDVRQTFLSLGFDIPKDSRTGALFFYGLQRKPKWKERLDIDSEDRIERLFKRVLKFRAKTARAAA